MATGAYHEGLARPGHRSVPYGPKALAFVDHDGAFGGLNRGGPAGSAEQNGKAYAQSAQDRSRAQIEPPTLPPQHFLTRNIAFHKSYDRVTNRYFPFLSCCNLRATPHPSSAHYTIPI